MTKNELKKEIFILEGKISTFQEITTQAEKEELSEYIKMLKDSFFFHVRKYEGRYNPNEWDEILKSKKHIESII